MSEPNSLTAIAIAEHRPASHTRAQRPPVVAWTLRMLLCMTDERTKPGETERLWERAIEELTEQQRSAVGHAVRESLTTMRKAVEHS